tara:strand:+ start:1029 stop:1778 length:750 start_codon:yes stop_codon:yes gene_type:complete
MCYKNFLIIFLVIITGCSTHKVIDTDKKIISKKGFTNKGFTIIYSDSLYKKKIISKKLDNRSLTIFQKNLPKGTLVKIKNILNNKTIIAKVGSKSNYPLFNNSVISKRISEEIEINLDEPYIEIFEILKKSSFIAKKAKTFDEEKKVAEKAPVENISINDLNETKKVKKIEKKKFNYIIKVADFYFKNTAKLMLIRINKETDINDASVQNLSDTQYRVFLGPYDNIKSLQKAFNDISVLEFENIEIIKK